MLPGVGSEYACKTEWFSDNPAVIEIIKEADGNYLGKVHPLDYQDITLTLTAEISREGISATKDFTVTVLNKWDTEVRKDEDAYDTWYGDGTDEEFYIYNAPQLAWFAKLVNDGVSFAGKRVILNSGNFIDMANIPWMPIGNAQNPFQGTFDGNDCVLNMRVGELYPAKALFGEIGANGIVRNTGVLNMNFSGGQYSGGIASVNRGRIANCFTVINQNPLSSGNNIHSDHSGGIASDNYGHIENCYFLIGIDGLDFGGQESAALVWRNNAGGAVVNCYHPAGVTAISIDNGLTQNVEPFGDNAALLELLKKM
jgi:hypothetical protein